MSKTTDIRDAVADELEFDPLVDATDITVRNMNGQVALNGRVASYPQYVEAAAAQRVAGVAAAEQTIAGLTGVRNINNEIEIRNYADPVDVTVRVQDALDRYALIP